ncbi:MAG: porin family protein [Tannerella sp.]|nr:porin family protein [Tannerella sp.]
MKRITLLLMYIIVSIAVGYAQKGHFSTGANLGYALYSPERHSVAAAVDVRYNILSTLRLSPSFTYVIKNNNLQTWYAAMDVHYLFNLTDLVTLYPIGGITFSNWDSEDPTGILIPERRHDGTWWSLNIGAGAETRLSDHFSVGLDIKYNTIEETLFLMRVAYHF